MIHDWPKMRSRTRCRPFISKNYNWISSHHKLNLSNHYIIDLVINFNEPKIAIPASFIQHRTFRTSQLRDTFTFLWNVLTNQQQLKMKQLLINYDARHFCDEPCSCKKPLFMRRLIDVLDCDNIFITSCKVV